jgi:HlyD family secretion protein
MRKPSELLKKDDKSATVKAASQTTPTDDTPQQGVFVVRDEHHNGKLRVTFVPVKTGVTGATDIQVTSGLNVGDQIVTGPYKILRTLENNSLVKLDTTGGVAPTGS